MDRIINNSHGFSGPWAANVAAAKMSESPGRKGVTTKPVSMKITKNNSPYVQAP
jgi:hypothetical protein